MLFFHQIVSATVKSVKEGKVQGLGKKKQFLFWVGGYNGFFFLCAKLDFQMNIHIIIQMQQK